MGSIKNVAALRDSLTLPGHTSLRVMRFQNNLSPIWRVRIVMKPTVALLVLLFASPAFAQAPKPAPTLRSILLKQLRNTHNMEDWFATASIAVQSVTPEQASWTEGKGNHSSGQLTNHLVFWDSQQLAKFNGQPPEKFSGENNETFNNFHAKNWPATVQKLDDVMSAWEKAVETTDDKKLEARASTIAHISTHNAYHIGQIVYIRKLQGSWDPSKGVK
jgi:uncharacterized damage-inducible protein DinB